MGDLYPFGGMMKYSIIIDPDREEEILIYAREKNPLVERLEELLSAAEVELLGYCGNEIATLSPLEVECFFLEDGRLFAMSGGKKYLLKQRLYQLEESVGGDFVKINQSCLVNVRAIDRFETKLGGALAVRLKCGYTDYVSRRQMRAVKEKFGI